MSENERLRKLQVGGTIYADRHLYITRRDVEEEVHAILSRGEYCNILSSRQVGKSSVMSNVALRLRAEGKRIVMIDVAGNLGSPEDADAWYQGFLSRVATDLRMGIEIRAWWKVHPGFTANEKLLDFFRREVFAESNDPVVIFVDEIDHTLGLEYTDDFFTAIRTMLNQRGMEPSFEKLTFCLVGVASPNELVKKRRTTPYNVGKTVELRDFDPERDDLEPLVKALSADRQIGQQLLSEILAWTGGHPYLTLRLCELVIEKQLRSSEDVKRVVVETFASLDKVSADIHFQQITRFLGTRVTDQLKTVSLYERILRGKRVRNDTTDSHIELKLSGIVRSNENGFLEVRNPIYARLFDLAWVRQTKPLRTERMLRRGLITAGAVVLMLLLGIGYYRSFVAPKMLIGKTMLTALENTSDEGKAREVFQTLTGQKGSDPGSVIPPTITGYEDQALTAYQGFWQRRGKSVEIRALQRLKDDDVDRALLLGAAAAVKANSQLHGQLLEVYRNYVGLYRTIHGSSSNYSRVDFDANSQLIAVGGKVYAIETGLMVTNVDSMALGLAPKWDYLATNEPASGSFDVAFSGTNALLATLSPGDNNGAIVQRLGIGTKLSLNVPFKFQPPNRAFCVQFSPEGRSLALGHVDGFTLFDFDTGKSREFELKRRETVTAIAFSPDGDRIATATRTSGAFLWKKAEDHPQRQLPYDEPLNAIAFRPDGRGVLAGGRPTKENIAGRLWDTQSGKVLFEITSQSGEIHAVACASNGKWVATLHLARAAFGGSKIVSRDDSIRIWKVASLTEHAESSALEESPAAIWNRVQLMVGYTLDDNDEVINLQTAGPRQLEGWDQTVTNRFRDAQDQPKR